MVDFPSAVAVPGTAAYAPPLMDFSWLANLPNQFAQGQKNKFDQTQRDRTLALQQPIDSTNTQQVLQEVLKRGGAQYAEALLPFMLQQEQMKAASAPDPMLAGFGGAQPPQPQQQPVGNPPPASMAGGSPTNMKTPVTQQGGDAGNGTITDIVTGKLGNTAQAGGLLARIALTMNVDPNAPLSQGQQVRVQGLLKKYAPDSAAPASAAPADAGAQPVPASRIADALAAVQPNAGAPAPQPQRPPIGGPAPVPAAPQPQPQPAQPQSAPAAAIPPQRAPGQQGAPGPIGPQVDLPQGFTDPMKAIMALRAHAAQVASNPNPYIAKRAPFFEQWANEIEKSVQPMEVRPGQTLLDRRSGQVLYQAPGTNATNVALQRFLEANPNATPEQIQAFVQSGKGARSAIGMYMNRFIAEHPDATADDIKRAAQIFTTQTTAQNRFLSGPQGNTIRSLNVVVSHLQTMQDLGDALKNGNIRMFNSIGQRWAEETGSPAPTNFDTAKQIVGAEVIKALGVAGAGSQAERQEAADAFNRARSPQQLTGAIASARKLLVGQLEGLRQQWKVATGRPGEEFDQMLQPETLQFFQRDTEKQPAGKAAPGSGTDNDGWLTLPNGNRIRQVQ